MSILRADGWEVKPGRADEIVAAATEIKPLLIEHGAIGARLMRISVGGTSTGLMYGEAEYEDLEALGAARASFMADESAVALVRNLNRADGPGMNSQMLLTEVIAECGQRTESIPGCVELIRVFKVGNEQTSEFLDIVGEMVSFTDRHNARLRVLRGLTGEFTGTLSTVVELADMAALGRYADDLWAEPAFLDLTKRIGSIANHVNGSVHAEVVT